MEQIQADILSIMQKSSKKGKSRITAVDLVKKTGCKGGLVRKALGNLTKEGALKFWTSGSSSYYMLEKDHEELKHKEEFKL